MESFCGIARGFELAFPISVVVPGILEFPRSTLRNRSHEHRAARRSGTTLGCGFGTSVDCRRSRCHGRDFDRYYRLVISVALRILHDVGDAGDVVQTVWFDFYQKAEMFDDMKGNSKTRLMPVYRRKEFQPEKEAQEPGFAG
jgi:hypothetical protein